MTKDEILQAAAQIFSQKGFHAASMADIALAVNLQKASLYHHFSSKQEILLALLDRAFDLMHDRITAATDQPLPPDEKLRLAMVVYMQILAEYQDLAVVLLLEYRSLDPEYRARHNLRRDQFERLWRDLVSEGKAAGVFTCADPSLAGRALFGVMNWSVTWFRRDGRMPIEAIADHFTHLFLCGLLVRPGEEVFPLEAHA